MSKIVVYGSGCKKCHKLYDNVLECLKLIGAEADVDYINDMNVIMQKGFMSLPVLEVDEKVVSSGKLLKVKEIQILL